MKSLKREFRTRWTTRLAALALCLATLAAVVPFALATASPAAVAADAVGMDAQGTDAQGTDAQGTDALVTAPPGTVIKPDPAFFSKAHFLNYQYSPANNIVYNQQTAFQKIFGFNAIYDLFMWTMNVYADTLRCTFTYEGKEWLIQLWKGSYGIVLATGGEIGVYNKPLDRKIDHYSSATQSDWLGMEMSIYNEGKYLFTRPFGQYWWCTGYYIGYMHGFLRRPRADCVMVSRIQLKSNAMAVLFAAQLRAKGFAPVDALDGLDTPDSYTINDDVVDFVWQHHTESFF